jgi:hypothetical protein
MARTIQIQGSDEVMAMFGTPELYYRGKWENVRIIQVSKDSDIPLEIRTALVGLIVPTIFTKESIEKQTGASFPIPEKSRLAYCIDVAEILKLAGKNQEAEQLISVASNPLDMYTLDASSYELLAGHSIDEFIGGRHPYKKDSDFIHPFRKD